METPPSILQTGIGVTYNAPCWQVTGVRHACLLPTYLPSQRRERCCMITSLFDVVAAASLDWGFYWLFVGALGVVATLMVFVFASAGAFFKS